MSVPHADQLAVDSNELFLDANHSTVHYHHVIRSGAGIGPVGGELGGEGGSIKFARTPRTDFDERPAVDSNRVRGFSGSAA